MSARKPKEAPAVWLAPSELVPWVENPRDNALAVKDVARSIERFGFAAPIVARAEDHRIIAGHTRWLAAQELGLAHIPVRLVPGLSDDEAAALALADNRLTEATPWDTEALTTILADLGDRIELDGLGWSPEELDALQVLPAVEVPNQPELGEEIAADVKIVGCPHCGGEVPVG